MAATPSPPKEIVAEKVFRCFGEPGTVVWVSVSSGSSPYTPVPVQATRNPPKREFSVQLCVKTLFSSFWSRRPGQTEPSKVSKTEIVHAKLPTQLDKLLSQCHSVPVAPNDAQLYKMGSLPN
jgi:hypothetical protein